MRFEWRTADRDAFERAVELLLERRHEKATTTFAPDGRGGDGGVDFWAQSRRSLRIYQLKHYADGFASSTRSRKNAVADSFETATSKHAPTTWVLVVPAKLTVPERKFVMGLKAQEGRRQPTIRILDLPKLELELSKHPEIRAHLDRQPLLDAIEERQIEVAEPRTVDEVRQRASRLAERGGHLDPDWDMDIFTVEGVTRVVPRPKPGVTPKTPLGLNIEIDPTRLTADVRAVLERSFGYGSGETVHIPQEAIIAVHSTGPSWQWFTGGGDLELEPEQVPAPDASVLMEVFDTSGCIIGEHEGVVTRAAPGGIGVSVDATFYQGLSMQLLLPTDRSVMGTCNMSLSVHRLYAADARDALGLYRVLRDDARTLTFSVDRQVLVRGTVADHAPEVDERMALLEQFASDFAKVQEHIGTRRMLPVEIPTLDRVMARVARLVLEGQCTYLPYVVQFTGTVSTGGDPRWMEQLRTTLLGPHAMYARLPSYVVDICGLRADLGSVGVYSPEVRIAEADRLLSLLEAGRADGEEVNYVAATTAGWRIAPLTAGREAPGEWQPTPWEAVSVAEHPALDVGELGR